MNMCMRGSRKLCQRGSNFDNVFVFVLVSKGREDQNANISGPSWTASETRADYGTTLNSGSVAL